MVSPTGLNTLIKVTKILQVLSSLSPDSLLQFFVRPWSWFTILKGWQLKGVVIAVPLTCDKPRFQLITSLCMVVCASWKPVQSECKISLGLGTNKISTLALWSHLGIWDISGPPGPNFLHIIFVPFPYFESSLYIFSPGQMGKLMNVPNVEEQALYFLERQFGVPCNVVQNKFLLQVLPLDDVNAHHRCLTIAGRQISRSLSFFFHITDWIFCTSNHWIFSSNNSERGN